MRVIDIFWKRATTTGDQFFSSGCTVGITEDKNEIIDLRSNRFPISSLLLFSSSLRLPLKANRRVSFNANLRSSYFHVFFSFRRNWADYVNKTRYCRNSRPKSALWKRTRSCLSLWSAIFEPACCCCDRVCRICCTQDKLESVLDVLHQQMEQYRDQPAHAEKIAYQQKLLQEDVVHIRAEISQISTVRLTSLTMHLFAFKQVFSSCCHFFLNTCNCWHCDH